MNSFLVSTVMGWVLLQVVRTLAAGDKQVQRRHQVEVMTNTLSSIFVSTCSLPGDLATISTSDDCHWEQKCLSPLPSACSQACVHTYTRHVCTRIQGTCAHGHNVVGMCSWLEFVHLLGFSKLSGIMEGELLLSLDTLTKNLVCGLLLLHIFFFYI